MPLVPNTKRIVNIVESLRSLSLFQPHLVVKDFNEIPADLPGELSRSLKKFYPEQKKIPDIRCLIIDKDNCITTNNSKCLFPEYKSKFESLKEQFKGNILIISNSAGSSYDKNFTVVLTNSSSRFNGP